MSQVQFAMVPSPPKGPSPPGTKAPTPLHEEHASPTLHALTMAKGFVRRWRRNHEQQVMGRIQGMREEKKRRLEESREEAQRLASKVPIDVLTKDWLNDDKVTIDVRCYMVDKLLPTLILGVEKLLLEVERRGLEQTEGVTREFNPINYLAQYLMRNNPRYSNFAEASPYFRGMQEVSEQLKREVMSYQDTRLARVKAEARRKREEREMSERLRQLESTRRVESLKAQFHHWIRDGDGNVQLSLVQSSLRSFREIVAHLPEDIQTASSFSKEIEPTDETGKGLNQEAFINYLQDHVQTLPAEVFDQFSRHLAKCALAHREAAEREARRIILSNLFISCDHTSIGLLDRHRILALFEKFWDGANTEVKPSLRNPRKWPIIELDEMDDAMSLSEDELDLQVSEMTEATSVSQNTSVAPQVSDEGEKKDLEKETPAIAEVKEGEETAEQQEKVPEAVAQEGEKGGGEKEGETEGEKGTEEKGAEEEPKGEEAAEKKDEDGQKEAEVQEEKAEEAGEKTEGDATKEEVTTEEGKAEESKTEGEKTEGEKEAAPAEDVKEEAAEAAGQEEAVEKPKEKQEEQQEQVTTATDEKKEEEVPKEKDAEKEEGVSEEQQKETSEGAETSQPEKEVVQDVPVTEAPKEPTEPTPAAEAGAEATETKKEEEEKATVVTTESEKPEVKEPEAAVRDEATESPTKTRTGRVSVTFSSEPPQMLGNDLLPPMTPDLNRSSSQMTQMTGTSVFDESSLNLNQFVQLVETFLGDHPYQEAVDHLVGYIQSGYVETEEEKMSRLAKARRDAISARHKYLLDQLFEKWDNDGSGFLDLEEVQTILLKYKEGMEAAIIKKARASLKKKYRLHDNRMNRREFRTFIEDVVHQLPGDDNECFEAVMEYLRASVERSYTERIRGDARKKWLQQIKIAAETGGASMDPVYRAVFNALYKDQEAHGGNKKISAYIAMLERNDLQPSRGETLLRYVAVTPEDAPLMLGKAMYKDMKGISFASVESGKPIHVPRVMMHGNIHLWNADRKDQEVDGSFMVVPLKDHRKRVFGMLGIDTMADPHDRSIFVTHEISFFQGIAKAFSVAFHYIDIRRKILRIAESAVHWIHRRSVNVKQIDVYMVEPGAKDIRARLKSKKGSKKQTPSPRKMEDKISFDSPTQLKRKDLTAEEHDFVLRKMMTTDKSGNSKLYEDPQRLERKDNLFRDYLFKSVTNSETVTADAYGERHTAFPLRDNDGRAVAVVDISIGELRELPHGEQREVTRMLKILQSAHKEVEKESAGAEKKRVLEIEKDDDTRIDIMFDRLMLVDLRQSVSKLDVQAFAELKSYKDPPPIIHRILKAVLGIFWADKAALGEFELWNSAKQRVTSELMKMIISFDPTSKDVTLQPDAILTHLSDIPHGAVSKHGSVPAQYLYNWAFVVISLVEHTSKSQDAGRPQAFSPPGSSASTDTNATIDAALKAE
ncbi:EF-hand calcium-binding domain-containing protein 5-like isoform X2 [Branchiostoma lanceolatum]|uniref:EF-hand calcium-binding domain-containing protein 5-like isoform X1 n=1 Tax=Branchiostoma lanceolatum TaxID=7740 RepID=UPI0034557918